MGFVPLRQALNWATSHFMPKTTERKLSPEDKKFYKDRTKWVELMFSQDFGHAEFRVLYFIGQRSNHKDRGSYWPVDRISEECQCSTKTVSEATMKAEKLGYLKIWRTVGQKNLYQPIFFWLCDT